jgi:hypothetical protein
MSKHESAIEGFINTYLENPDPRYAILINGEWGCGKTYFVREFLETYSQRDDIAPKRKLKPICITLFGKDNIEQVNQSILQALHPILYSKGAEVIKSLAKFAGKIALRTDFDTNKDGKNDVSITSSIDALSVFSKGNGLLDDCRFIIFDDFERCLIDVKTILGYINYFIEQCNCYAIIVGDESKVNDIEALNEFKEKTIGREFYLQPDTVNAVKTFLSEKEETHEWLRTQLNLVVKVFNATKSKNLRVLRQCIYDFNNALRGVDKTLVNSNRNALQRILASYIVVCVEYRCINKEPFKNWKANYNIALLNLPSSSEKKDAISALQEKYSTLTEQYDVLNPKAIECVVADIEGVKSIATYIVDYLKKAQQKPGVIEQLANFLDLEEESFNKACEDAIFAFTHEKKFSIYDMGRFVSIFSFFDFNKMYWFPEAAVSLMKVQLTDRVNSCKSREELTSVQSGFIQGCNSYTFLENLPTRDEMVQYLDKAVQLKETKTPYNIQILLGLEITEENIKRMSQVDNIGLYSDKSYTLFSNVDLDTLFRHIITATQSSRLLFRDFLSKHYTLSAETTLDYKTDLPYIEKLYDKIENTRLASGGPARYTYNRLADCLSRCVRRCRGEQSAVES